VPDAKPFQQLFDLLGKSPKLALAVSGGSDSTALMVLAADWAKQNGHSDLCVLTVDHALRENSGIEAKQVYRSAKALGLKCQILTWQHQGQSSRIQENARTARYQLMAEWCRDNDYTGIITAHNSDDQAETLMMRLARGSGVDGLAAMAAKTELFATTIYRPLLDVSRTDLRAVLIKAKHDWIEDPCNEDTKFERVRIRQTIENLEKSGLEKTSLTLSAKRLQRARSALEVMTDSFMTQAVTVFNTGHCEIDRPAFKALPDEIAIRALSRLIMWAGGAQIAVRMSKVERLLDVLGQQKTDKHTLAGAQIAARKNTLIIGREFGRIETAMQTGVTNWDNRFVFTEPQNVAPYGLFIDTDQRSRPPELPHFVTCALPVFHNKKGTITVPHLDCNLPKTIHLKTLPHGALLTKTSPPL